MDSGSVEFDGSSGVAPTTFTNAGARIVVTANGNVIAWALFDSGIWKIYVSDSTFSGKVYYSIDSSV